MINCYSIIFLFLRNLQKVDGKRTRKEIVDFIFLRQVLYLNRASFLHCIAYVVHPEIG